MAGKVQIAVIVGDHLQRNVGMRRRIAGGEAEIRVGDNNLSGDDLRKTGLGNARRGDIARDGEVNRWRDLHHIEVKARSGITGRVPGFRLPPLIVVEELLHAVQIIRLLRQDRSEGIRSR